MGFLHATSPACWRRSTPCSRRRATTSPASTCRPADELGYVVTDATDQLSPRRARAAPLLRALPVGPHLVAAPGGSGPIGCPGEPPAGRGAAGGGGRPPRLLHLEPRAPAGLRDRRAARGRPARRHLRGARPRRSRTSCSPRAPATPPTRPTSRSAPRCSAPHGCPCSACAWACRGWSRRTAGAVERVAPAHGDVVDVTHDGTGVFAGIPSPYPSVRYHSLAATRVPDELDVTARCVGEDGADVVMGVRHTQPAAARRAVPPRVDPQRARRPRWSPTSWSVRDRPRAR